MLAFPVEFATEPWPDHVDDGVFVEAYADYEPYFARMAHGRGTFDSAGSAVARFSAHFLLFLYLSFFSSRFYYYYGSRTKFRV